MSAGAFVECADCDGTGKITFWRFDNWDEKPCAKCKGKGGEIIGFTDLPEEQRPKV